MEAGIGKEGIEYKQKKLSPVLIPLVAQILQEKPHSVVSCSSQHQPKYIVDFLEKNYMGGGAFSERAELEALRDEVAHLKGDAAGEGSEAESMDDSDDEVDELPQHAKPLPKGPRTSVSAEAYGMWNKKQEFKARVIPKPEATKQKIAERLNDAFMFQNLESDEKEVVIMAMEEKKFNVGDLVIEQGTDGDDLYVVEEGTLECTKVFVSGYNCQSGSTEPKFLKNYEPGEAFGELALLYNAPRAATIKAKTPCKLWCLDRPTFNHIVKESASKRRDKYEEFLKSVKILSSMDVYERQKLPDALKTYEYSEGDYVINQGDDGNMFYILISGEAIATKSVDGAPPKEVMQYKEGDYFGELALLKNEPRAANVIAKTNCKLAGLDRHSFKRLLGPLEEILKRNMDHYKEYC